MPDIVAIVDDDVVVRDSLKFLLEAFGYSVEAFSSAADFLGQFQSSHERFRCLIVDLKMPDATGLDLVGGLRADGYLIPAALITAAPTPETLRIAAEIGIGKVLTKPVPQDELLAFVSTVKASQ